MKLSLSTLLLILAIGSLENSGCKRSSSAPSRAEQSWPITGEVVSVSTERRTLTVQHEEVKGLMPAMTMEFKANTGDLALAKTGKRFRATLVKNGSDFELEKLWWENPVADREVLAGAKALKQDTVIRGKEAYREIGETLPDATLYDQEGRAVAFNRFRGKRIVMNFIFSRCPIANMCPAATQRMVALQQAAKEGGINDLELISITLDPAYDTPGVLKEYATTRGIDTGNFSLLTGPEAAIQDLLTQMGIIAEFENGLLKHSLSTLLIDQNGKIIHREDGSVWKVESFIERLKGR